jgi:hypothetical protein
MKWNNEGFNSEEEGRRTEVRVQRKQKKLTPKGPKGPERIGRT